MNEIRHAPSPVRMVPADPCAGCDGRMACELSRPVRRCCANCVCACPLALACCGGTALVCANRPECPGELKVVECDGACRNFRARRRPILRTDPASLPEPPDDSIRYIPLTYGKFAMVDAADYEWLSKYRWHAVWSGQRFYAQRGSPNGRTSVFMHREIMKPPRGMVVDHIDGNGLDQRRCNLRICTPRENGFNTRSHGGTSRFKGVSRRGDRWEARITHNGKEIPLGVFDDEAEAARARDEMAHNLQREYAWLNFPEDKEPGPEDNTRAPEWGAVPAPAEATGPGRPGGSGKRPLADGLVHVRRALAKRCDPLRQVQARRSDWFVWKREIRHMRGLIAWLERTESGWQRPVRARMTSVRSIRVRACPIRLSLGASHEPVKEASEETPYDVTTSASRRRWGPLPIPAQRHPFLSHTQKGRTPLGEHGNERTVARSSGRTATDAVPKGSETPRPAPCGRGPRIHVLPRRTSHTARAPAYHL